MSDERGEPLDGGTAVVLGGGGVAGIAWETGMLVGLAQAGVDLSTADVVIGTSAGSVAGGLLLTGGGAAALAASSGDDPGPDTSALGPLPDLEAFMDAAAAVLSSPAATPEEARARIGAMAVRLPAERQDDRLAIFRHLLGTDAWPDRLRTTAVDAETGRFRVFDARSGVPFLAAVAASCAVPVVYPTVEIEGRRWMDGGMRSAANADLAAGADRVVVIACGPEMPWSPLGPQLDEAVRALRQHAEVALVLPDEASAAAFGSNALDAASRGPAAAAGLAQSAAEVEQVRAVWG